MVECTSNGCLGRNVRVSEMTLVPLRLFPFGRVLLPKRVIVQQA